MGNAALPELSAVLVVGERRDRAALALASLLGQGEVALEIVLVDCAPRAASLPGSAAPTVVRVELPAGLFSQARALGVRRARAPVVAFVEEHCRVRPGWAAALVEAHRGPWVGVGAEVHCGNPAGALSRAVALMNYHPWLAPAQPGEHALLPGHNSSFKRAALLAYGERLEELLRAEVLLYAALGAAGGRLFLEPRAAFEHDNETRLADIVHGFFLWHRLYGPLRAREAGWGLARRAFYVLGAPLVPAYFALRLLAVLARRRPSLLGAGLRGLPYMLVAQAASAAGQALGLVVGPGQAERAFTQHELGGLRPGTSAAPPTPGLDR
jgi:hypothetical protein